MRHTTHLVNDLVAVRGKRGTALLQNNDIADEADDLEIQTGDPATLPRLDVTKSATGVGTGVGQVLIEVPATDYNTRRKETRVLDVATVDAGLPIRYELKVSNEGGSTAKRCTIYDELASNAVYDGTVEISDDGGANYLLAGTGLFVLRDDKLAVIGANDTANWPRVRFIEFLMGNVAPGKTYLLRYRVKTPEKAGTFLITEALLPKKDNAFSTIYETYARPGANTTLSGGFQARSDSCQQSFLGAPDLVVAKTIAGVAFNTSSSFIRTEDVPGGALNHLQLRIANQGDSPADKVTVKITIPKGTSIEKAFILDPANEFAAARTTFDYPATGSRLASITLDLGDLHKRPADGRERPREHGPRSPCAAGHRLTGHPAGVRCHARHRRQIPSARLQPARPRFRRRCREAAETDSGRSPG